MENDLKRNERGMLTVEAVLSLVPFIIIILGIISFINIFMVHNKIQYAMYEAANELTAYTYFYQISGLRAANTTFDNDRKTAEKPVRDEIAQVTKLVSQMNALKNDYNSATQNVENMNVSGLKADVQSAYNNAQGAANTGKAVLEGGKELLKDPRKLIAAFVYYVTGEGLNAMKTWLLSAITAAMVEDNLDATTFHQANLISNPQDADTFLKDYGVVDGIEGIDYGASKLFEDDGHKIIEIVAQYDIEVYIFKLFFTDPKIHVVQKVSASAWLNGDGDHKDGKGHYKTQ